jgi:hypothetical protein
MSFLWVEGIVGCFPLEFTEESGIVTQIGAVYLKKTDSNGYELLVSIDEPIRKMVNLEFHPGSFSVSLKE